VKEKANSGIGNNGWLLLAIGLGLLAPVLTYQGVLLGGDDVLYARLGADMASGNPTFGINTHPCRLGFIAPLAGLYAVFGIHDWTTVAFPFLCSMLAVFFTSYAANRLYGRKAAAWAALLCGLNPILYRNGSTGMPDIAAGFFYGLFVAGWLMVVAKRVRHRRIWAFIAGVACAWAMATRISIAPMIIVTLPGFLVLGWQRSTLREFPFQFFLLGGCLVGIPYLLSLWWYTGTPFYFFNEAAGGYNADGAPWIQPLEGLRFWMRLSGLSILKASVEGFLFAVFPIIVAMMTIGRNSGWEDPHHFRRHLLLAIISPLMILSYFSTKFSQWYPVHLDLRFGSAVIIPTAILVAGACVHFSEIRFSKLSKISTSLALLFSVLLLVFGFKQQNLWTMMGAGAAIIVGLAVFQGQRRPVSTLPLLVVMILCLNWWYYVGHDYADVTGLNTEMRIEAQTVPWDPNIPILTDGATVQYLPYLHAFSSKPRVVQWKGDGNVKAAFLWADQCDAPLPEQYLLVWHPQRAYVQTGRWGGRVPQWVLQAAAQGKLLRQFENKVELPPPVFDLPKNQTHEYRTWPRAGIYLIDKDS
jgi:4-amino-4-deoxy-L-arabinose transferase-like glycosyltransferase